MTDKTTDTESRPLEGRVATILSDRELAINIGSEDGVEYGMIFLIPAKTPIEIRDPVSNDLLGTIPREKARLNVTRVEPRFSVCRTLPPEGPRGSSITAITRMIGETFAEGGEVLSTAGELSLPEDERYVRRGDKVTEVLPDQE